MSGHAGCAAEDVRFASINADGRPLRIEYAWIAPQRKARPLLVFLHEGLGSLAMWRDFPRTLCDRGDFRGLVFSRPGYGRSTPRRAGERWAPDFMHRQAETVLPRLFEALGHDTYRDPPWLFGHSDGGSIALLFASQFPDRVAGVIAVAPHIFVEPVSIASIQAAREAYRSTDLASRLRRYHDDPDSAFWGWNDVWLDPAFRSWNIEDALTRIECPVLAVQGCDDEYGTLEQVRGIARRLPGTTVVEIPACGHSPHRDQPARLVDEVLAFVARYAHARPPVSATGFGADASASRNP